MAGWTEADPPSATLKLKFTVPMTESLRYAFKVRVWLALNGKHWHIGPVWFWEGYPNKMGPKRTQTLEAD